MIKDTYENMENRLKKFVMELLKDAKDNPEEVDKFRSRACGAILFALNYLFPFYNDDLANWWDFEILPLFDELEA